MYIFVRIGLSWRNICLDVEPSDTILNIKEKIYDKEGIPTYRLLIICKSKPTSEFQTVSDLNTAK